MFNTPASYSEIIRIILRQDASYTENSILGLTDLIHKNSGKVKVWQSLYRPWGLQILWQSAHEGGKL